MPRATQNPALEVLEQVDRCVRAALDSRGGAVQVADAGRDPLVERLVRTILTHRASLDWLIGWSCRGRVRPRLRRVLWWALAEELYLDGLPTPVIVDTAVAAVKRRSPAEARFVNAVLRRLFSRCRDELFDMLMTESTEAVRTELGRELHRLWSARFSRTELLELGELLCQPPPVIMRMRPGFRADDFTGVAPMPSPAWAPGSRLLRCLDMSALLASPGWERGGGYIQDPATLLAPSMLEVNPGERVADLCAAPGGKSLVLLEALEGRGVLMCMDRSERRLGRLLENLSGVSGWTAFAGDATAPPLASGCIDACLLDVPCSNTGVVRRRPDIRWHVSREHVCDMAELQARLLRAVSRLPRRGGRLAYSTCSIEPQENEEVVGAFLEDSGGEFTLKAQRLLMPGKWHDGAYAALLVRR